MIARLLENVRRRSAIRRAIVGLYDNGVCAHVKPVVVTASDGGTTAELVHLCGHNCPWFVARRTAEEHLGAW